MNGPKISLDVTVALEGFETIADLEKFLSVERGRPIVRFYLGMRTTDSNIMIVERPAPHMVPAPGFFPLQRSRHQLNEPSSIPMALAEKVYENYAKRFGTQQSLQRLGQRGGFGIEEMDQLYPKWREEV